MFARLHLNPGSCVVRGISLGDLPVQVLQQCSSLPKELPGVGASNVFYLSKN